MLKKELDDLFKKLGKNKNKVAILNKIVKYASDNNANYKEVILALQDAKNVNFFKQAQAMELEQSAGGVKVYTEEEEEANDLDRLIYIEESLNNKSSIMQRVSNMFNSITNKSNKIMNIMKKYINNIKIQIIGCRALANIAADAADNQLMVADAGGIEAVVAAMKAHLENADVQKNGCAALGNIAMLAETKRMVAAAGGIEAVVAAMEAHLNNAVVQENGCGALRNIAALAENQPKVVAAGGIEAVVAAMNADLKNAAVQEQGYYALWNIAFNDKTIPIYVSARDIEAMVAIMNAHLKNAAVQEFFCKELLKKITEDHLQNRYTMVTAGGIEAVVNAMNEHLKNAVVQENGCRILKIIAVIAGKQLKVAVVNAGGIKAVVDAMKEHLNNAAIQENGCMALRSITNNMNIIQLIDIISVLESNINICPELKNILDGISIDKMIKIKIGFINNNEDTLSCEELLKNIRYFDKHIYNRTTVTECGHVFHTDCLNRWKLEGNTCPNCREKLKVGGNSEDKEICSICHDNLVIKNEDIFNTVSASYDVFIEILKRCNDDAELKKRIEEYNPKAEPSSANAGGKKKIKR